MCPEELLDGITGTDLTRVTAAQDLIERFERAGHLEIGELRAAGLAGAG